MMVTAVIPARNEAKHLQDVVTRTQPFVDRIVIVDDGSTDDTWAIAQSFGNQVTAVRHSINLGKGAALKTGCEAACALKTDIIVSMDADNQHKPEMIPQFVAALTAKQADIVFGVRKFNSEMPAMMFLGNHVLTIMVNLLFHVLVHDTQSGYRAFTSNAFHKMALESSGYEVETEMIIRVSEQKLVYTEVPIDTIYHDSYKGTTMIDGLKIFLRILRWRFI